jgi:hypothetical protein
MKQIIIIIIFIFSLAKASASDTTFTKKPDFKKIGNYDKILNRFIKGDRQINFLDLRMSFTRTPEYNPYNKTLDTISKKMIGLLSDKKYKEAIKIADTILLKEYVDMYAHYACYYAFSALNDTNNARFHEYIMDRLLNSIVESGDGKTPASAFLVISNREIYFLIFIYGFEPKGVSYSTYNGDPIEIHTVYDPKDKDTYDLHFNTSLMLQRQDTLLREKK